MPSLSERFAVLGPREQRWITLGVGVLCLALLIGVGVLPAVHRIRANPKAQQQAGAQLQNLRLLQFRAQTLQAQPQLDQAEAITRLKASVSLLGGNSELSISDERVHVVLRATPAKAVAEWLARARKEAHAVPVEARLARETQSEEALWSGTLVMALPPR